MAWEHRGRSRYLYRSKRVTGRIVKTYLGRGPEAETAARQNELARQRRRELQQQRQRHRAEYQAVAVALRDLSRELDGLVASGLEAAGFHRHNRGHWRRRRGSLCT